MSELVSWVVFFNLVYGGLILFLLSGEMIDIGSKFFESWRLLHCRSLGGRVVLGRRGRLVGRRVGLVFGAVQESG